MKGWLAALLLFVGIPLTGVLALWLMTVIPGADSLVGWVLAFVGWCYLGLYPVYRLAMWLDPSAM